MANETKRMIEDYLSSIAWSNTPEDISNIISLIESPFWNGKNTDVLSLIFHKFYKNTDIPIALPVFGFFGIISAWLVKNKANMLIPLSQKPIEVATWVMALAESGSSKTLSMKQIIEMLPEDPTTGKKVIEPNFEKPNGPAAMVKQLSELPDKRGFWFLDEASQMFKLLEQYGHPMAEIKEVLLKAKDQSPITRITAKENIKVEGIVLTQFFINTIDSMAKALSDESMKDGLFRRYQIAMATKDTQRPFEEYALYDLSKLIDDRLQNGLIDVFIQNIANVTFTFSKDCIELYKEMFKVFWVRQYSKFMVNSEHIYRTYMMESWKYAIFHHIINKKQGTEIQAESLQYGLKVVMFLLNSLQAFIKYRACQESVVVHQNKIEKLINFIKENENKKGFGVRLISRKFTMTKEDLISNLRTIRLNEPKFKTKLFEKLEIK